MNGGTIDDRDVDGGAIEARMGSHVEGIMSAARKAAAQFQAEVERAASERAAQIETAAARRAHAVRMGAEAEAEQLVAQARAATQQYVTASRRLVDEFARERMTRIAEVADRLAAQAEALLEPLARSEELARQLDELRSALGTAARRIVVESGRESPEMPDLPVPASIVDLSAADVQERVEDAGLASSATLEERLARATGRSRRRVVAFEDDHGDEATAVPEPAPDARAGVDGLRLTTQSTADEQQARRAAADELRLVPRAPDAAGEDDPREGEHGDEG